MHDHLQTPILVLVFNRPDQTRQIFNAIKEAKPKKLLVVADGPRLNKPGEQELCEQTRTIFEDIDWPCEVLRNFSDTNLGCRNRVSSGITWAFEQVEEAIILEDDCLPTQDFFRFCSEMLNRYRDDNRIGLISGDNFLPNGINLTDSSYYFTRNTFIWGWASWRRSIKNYDLDMSDWPKLRASNWLSNVFDENYFLINYWDSIFNRVFLKEIDTWDYQLLYSFLLQGYINICPHYNLISNIGFGVNATHTHEIGDLANLHTFPLPEKLADPMYFGINRNYELFFANNIQKVPFTRLPKKISSIFNIDTFKIDSLSTEEQNQHSLELLSFAMKSLQIGDAITARNLSEICLSLGLQVRDLYYVHALSCLCTNSIQSAKESLNIELSLYPDNIQAKETLLSITQ